MKTKVGFASNTRDLLNHGPGKGSKPRHRLNDAYRANIEAAGLRGTPPTEADGFHRTGAGRHKKSYR